MPGPLSEQEVAHLSAYRAVGLDDSPGVVIKDSPGLLFGWHIKNTTAAALYVQLFDADELTDVTLGTTVSKLSVGIEANGKAEISLPKGIRFNTGIVAFATTDAGGSTGAAADAMFFFG